MSAVDREALGQRVDALLDARLDGGVTLLTLGGVAEFKQIGGFIVEVLDGLAAKGEAGDSAVEADVKSRVHALTDRFPIYG